MRRVAGSRQVLSTLRWVAFAGGNLLLILHTGGPFLTAALAAPSPPAGMTSDWLAQARSRIEAQEFHITWQSTPFSGTPQAWHAPNRQHNLRAFFTSEGVRVIPRTDLRHSWEWGLSLVGYARGEDLSREIGPATLTPHENRVELSRGSIEEWYLNGPRGLEQGFLLKVPPEEAGAEGSTQDRYPGHVALVMKLTGTLSAFPAADRQSIDFLTAQGARAVHYAELKVTDASGARLTSWMEAASDHGMRVVRILIDDSGANYPITVDPLATSPVWMAESDQAGAGFGTSVGTAGDVNADGFSDVIVGAAGYDNGEPDEGRAFVYHGSASGLSMTAAWTAESNQAAAGFGLKAATAGDVNGDGYGDVIVAALGYANDQAAEGRVFLYLGSASGLSPAAAWTAEGNQPSPSFGRSVGTAGDVNGDGYSDVIVGASHYDNGETDEGRAYVYHGSAAGPAATPDWTAESDQIAAQLGWSAATAGDVNGDGYADVIVGANGYDNVEISEGRAFVYLGSASGLSPTAGWTGESNQASAQFGFSVGTAGDVNGDGYADIIVGATLYDNAEANEGRAYLYLGSASGSSAAPAWTAESDQVGAQFGSSVGTAGDVNGDGYADVVVGSHLYDNPEPEEGKAYVYLGSNEGLSATATWTAESDQAGANFGAFVATAGDVNGDGYSDVIVGAANYDNVEINEGRAYVYLGSASGPSPTAGWTHGGYGNRVEAADQRWSASTAGDVNGDGYADVIVGAPSFDTGLFVPERGAAFLYMGTSSGLSAEPAWSIEGHQSSLYFGYSVGTAGDVNRDGYTDVIVGAPGYFNDQGYEGAAFVYLGSASGLSFGWMVEGNQANSRFGCTVGTAGDVNGDGYSDVIVGASDHDNGETDEGRAYAYYGSASGLSPMPDWTAETDQASAKFGWSVATAGDVNRDGYADVIVGARNYTNVESAEGRASVYLGSASGLSTTAAWSAESNQASALFGTSVGTAGDVNGDGYADVIVGANRYDNGLIDQGRVYVYLGSATGLSLAAGWTAESNQASAFFGDSVATAGDVNGDGYADVIVGASGHDNGELSEGRAYVYLGSGSGLSPTPTWTAESNQPNALFGTSVASAGDVNGDGYADALVGAPSYFTPGDGMSFLYYGNGGQGLNLRPQQHRSASLVPIAPLGSSDSADSFRLSALGRAPFGRTLVKLEWENKPLGIPLDGTGIETGDAWTDTGLAGAALDELVAGLSSRTVHHWRVRLRYHPARTPLQARTRWFTVPWNGWQEADLRTPLQADLAVTQTDVADPVLCCEDLTYLISVSNAGPDGTFAMLRITPPGGSSVVAATSSQGSCGAPVEGVITCQLGSLAPAGGANVNVTVTPASAGAHANSAEVSHAGVDPNASNNADSESTAVLPLSPGDRVWEDLDGDGIQDAGEAGLADVLVALYDGSGQLLDAVLTDAAGEYLFPDQTRGATYRVRFLEPPGYILAPKDQGSDDGLDSDADSDTEMTPPFALAIAPDRFRWDAGMVPFCVPPDEQTFIYLVATAPGTSFPILHFQDANQPAQVTGYNVYRSSSPSPPPTSWLKIASDVIDMDEATLNRQWIDQSVGDPPPGGVWYYKITAFNSRCPAEGPF